ncbi:hypothetical protein Cgig2_033734 [Carnegiea gigantea]|uniref:Uncharacterized protein n=1 Tax=Carnegiea gigantea TaxID=171969 RepID=A0A9Q1K1H2_9CARY|nr:hypothetical protein Cgig2_033734 [Carnegiea gigantea]
MATCSSSTADIFAESARAGDHDLASFSTKVRFVGASAARKSAIGARVCLMALPLLVMKIPYRLESHRPSIPLPFDEGAPALKDVGANVAATSYRRSIRRRLWETKRGRRTVRKDKCRVIEGKPSWPAPARACTVPPPGPSWPRQQLAQPWHLQTPKAITSPSLALHKTKESQVRINRKIYTREKRLVPLENSLRISKPAAAKKKSLAKYFSIGNQYIGSLSLDLLCFRSGPFWASTTRAMNLGIGLGRSSS